MPFAFREAIKERSHPLGSKRHLRIALSSKRHLRRDLALCIQGGIQGEISPYGLKQAFKEGKGKVHSPICRGVFEGLFFVTLCRGDFVLWQRYGNTLGDGYIKDSDSNTKPTQFQVDNKHSGRWVCQKKRLKSKADSVCHGDFVSR